MCNESKKKLEYGSNNNKEKRPLTATHTSSTYKSPTMLKQFVNTENPYLCTSTQTHKRDMVKNKENLLTQEQSRWTLQYLKSAF